MERSLAFARTRQTTRTSGTQLKEGRMTENKTLELTKRGTGWTLQTLVKS